MYYVVGHDPEMRGAVEFHPPDRFYARLEGIVHTVFSHQQD